MLVNRISPGMGLLVQQSSGNAGFGGRPFSSIVKFPGIGQLGFGIKARKAL
jgi:hypothetical protein